MAGAPTIGHSSDRPADSRTWYVLSALVVVLLLLFYLLLSGLGMLSSNVTGPVQADNALSILSSGVFLAASVVGILKATNLRIRNGIIAFAISALIFLGAEASRAMSGLGVSIEATVTDSLFLPGMAVFIGALYLVRKSIVAKKFDIKAIAVLVIGSVVLGGLILLVSTVISNSPAVQFSAFGLAHLVLDFIALALMLDLMMTSRGRGIAESQIIMAVGVVILTITDIIFTVQASIGLEGAGPLKDFLFAIGYLLFAISVWRSVALTRRDIVNDRIVNLQKRSAVK